MIPETIVRAVRERTDIVALVSEFVPLKRAGQSQKGLCPFHAEKSPSFHVSPARQTFHCFGCGAGGDVFQFLMRVEGRTFPEALRELARRAGITVPDEPSYDAGEERRARARVERLAGILELAAGFYQRMLREHPHGPIARDAVLARGLGDADVERFRLGYAPASWDALATLLREKGLSPADAESVGLVSPRRNGGHYDRFRHRLMFPVSDPRGRIVAFSGRALPPPPGAEEFAQGDSGKYVNSPESPLYHKGDLLYGLFEARLDLRRSAQAILVEGNFDVVSMHHHGFPQTVAPLGTALTPTQARLLRRYAERVTVVFDGDAAGLAAVRSALPSLFEAGLAARVVMLPDKLDPDSMLREHGADALKSLLDSADGIVEFVIDRTHEKSPADAASRARAIESLGAVLALVRDPVERGLYVQRVAQRFGVRDIASVRATLAKGARSSRSPRPGGEPAEQVTASERRPGADGSPDQTDKTQSSESRPLPPNEALLVGLVLDQPGVLEDAHRLGVAELLTSPALCAIFHAAARMVEEQGKIDGPALLDVVNDAGGRVWLSARLARAEVETLEGAAFSLKKTVETLRRRRIMSGPAAQMKQEILEAARRGDRARLEAAQRERDELRRQASGPSGPNPSRIEGSGLASRDAAAPGGSEVVGARSSRDGTR
ncbi:MAG: DNA primase [Deltaproteobacteria bacterium]|nr:DNA primase [Deltaproteobacteria bacterium]